MARKLKTMNLKANKFKIMNKHFFITGLAIFLATSAIGQKKNVTDAILLMRKYDPTGELAANKKTVAEAKNFIDLAAANPETAEDFKMHFYRGQIYYALIETATLEAAQNNGSPDRAALALYKESVIASFDKVRNDPKKTFKADAENFINAKVDFVFNIGILAYNNKKYEDAAKAFLAAYEIKTFLGETFKDAEINTSLAANYAVEDYLAVKKYDEALTFANTIAEAMPQNIDILISMVNINLQKGDVAATEACLKKALALDPNNKQLYYVLGTSYMDKKENDKATAALQKALEIDPNYNEALYQLGAHLYNLAVEKRNASVELDYKDPKAAQLEAQAMDLFKEALVPLEKYASQNADEKAILDILYKTNMKLGNIEKAKEYKARLDAIKD